MPVILFVSNGYGEDTIACGIIRCLRQLRPDLSIRAMPLVGEGSAYARAGVERIGPCRLLPSGGLIHSGMAHLVSDLRAGLVRLTWEQIQTLWGCGASQVVAVGDIFPVVMGGLFCHRPLLFVGTARSDWFYSYSTLEMRLFRRLCQHLWTRDEPTARTLRRHGISASWVGNAMMDCLDGLGTSLPVPSGRTPIALLAGSREATYRDLPVLLDAARCLGTQYVFLAALADSIDVDTLRLAAAEWVWSGEVPSPWLGRLERDGVRVYLGKGVLGSVLEQCTLVLGQAGTANEQAAGLGRPVVAFDSTPGGKYGMGWYRARQKGLLGDALQVVAPQGQAMAEAVSEILSNTALYTHMAQTGRERLGPPGASSRMAEEISFYMI